MIRLCTVKYLECDREDCRQHYPEDRMGCSTKDELLTKAREAGWRVCEDGYAECPTHKVDDDPRWAATDRAYEALRG